MVSVFPSSLARILCLVCISSVAMCTYGTNSTSSSSLTSETTTKKPLSRLMRVAGRSYIRRPNSNQLQPSTRSCLFEGRMYRHGANVTRSNPCETCMCFRGEVLCWSRECPHHKPTKGCREVHVPNMCCPIFECDRNSAGQRYKPSKSWFPTKLLYNRHKPANLDKSAPACEIDGKMYRVNQIIPSASNACLECRCGDMSHMKCTPKRCYQPAKSTAMKSIKGKPPVRIAPNPETFRSFFQ